MTTEARPGSDPPATRYELDRGVATITLDRPEQRNALSVELVNSLGDDLTRAMGDPAVRAVVLTHSGPAFCAGADLKQRGGSGATPPAARFDLPAVFDLVQQGAKPVVARVAGHAMGGGVGLVAACDLSVASSEVLFGFSEVRRGVAPAIISVVCLPKLRRADASELFLTGRRVPAAVAAEVGLINRAVPPDDLDAVVDGLLDELTAGGPNALAAAKQLVARVPDMDRAAAFAWTSALSASLFRSEEAAAGMAAFRDKTDPPWVPERRRPAGPTSPAGEA